jgi:hypothetical protein
MEKIDPAVWVCFVGEKGDALKEFNSKAGPFPPQPGTKGYIAIGWPQIGNLTMYEGNYADYAEKFARLYNSSGTPQAKAIVAAMPWKFAFDMKVDDWVISPSSFHRVILIGQISGDYEANYENKLGFPESRRTNYVHTREVVWKYRIEKPDSRYLQFSGLGKLTIFKPDISPKKLQEILSSVEEWERKTARSGSLAEFLLASPLRGAGLDLERSKDDAREIEP